LPGYALDVERSIAATSQSQPFAAVAKGYKQ
jgi:hypothetical protein